MGPHTTADDPLRYRSGDEAGEWEARDPLLRVRLLLERAGEWSEDWQSEIEDNAAATIEAAVEWAESVPAPTREEMLGRMFEEPTPPLMEQGGE
jgi:pyruvate dehydrogenase E1 component alpha subunit